MYLLHGKLTAITGQSDQLASILLEASKLVSTAKGCKLYAVSKSSTERDSVYVTEIWERKEDHDNSLNVEGVRDLIKKAMPILNGPPAPGQQLDILGGAGI